MSRIPWIMLQQQLCGRVVVNGLSYVGVRDFIIPLVTSRFLRRLHKRGQLQAETSGKIDQVKANANFRLRTTGEVQTMLAEWWAERRMGGQWANVFLGQNSSAVGQETREECLPHIHQNTYSSTLGRERYKPNELGSSLCGTLSRRAWSGLKVQFPAEDASNSVM